MSAETEARQLEVAAMFERHGPGYRWWAVVTVMLGTVSAIMEATVVNVALPEIIRVFEVGHDQMQLLSTGFLAATTASMLLATWAMQRFGIRRAFVGALLLLVMFSVFAALSDRFELLALFLEGRERQLNEVHGLRPMQEGFFLIAFVYCLALIPAWMMTGRTQRPLSA